MTSKEELRDKRAEAVKSLMDDFAQSVSNKMLEFFEELPHETIIEFFEKYTEWQREDFSVCRIYFPFGEYGDDTAYIGTDSHYGKGFGISVLKWDEYIERFGKDYLLGNPELIQMFYGADGNIPNYLTNQITLHKELFTRAKQYCIHENVYVDTAHLEGAVRYSAMCLYLEKGIKDSADLVILGLTRKDAVDDINTAFFDSLCGSGIVSGYVSSKKFDFYEKILREENPTPAMKLLQDLAKEAIAIEKDNSRYYPSLQTYLENVFVDLLKSASDVSYGNEMRKVGYLSRVAKLMDIDFKGAVSDAIAKGIKDNKFDRADVDSLIKTIEERVTSQLERYTDSTSSRLSMAREVKETALPVIKEVWSQMNEPAYENEYEPENVEMD
jgi:hypothetical protein